MDNGVIKKGDTVVVTLSRLPGTVIVGKVRGLGSRSITVVLDSGESVRMEWADIGEIVRVPVETAREVVQVYCSAYAEYERECRLWEERRNREFREFLERWHQRHPYPQPPRLKDLAERREHEHDHTGDASFCRKGEREC